MSTQPNGLRTAYFYDWSSFPAPVRSADKRFNTPLTVRRLLDGLFYNFLYRQAKPADGISRRRVVSDGELYYQVQQVIKKVVHINQCVIIVLAQTKNTGEIYELHPS